MTDKIKYWWSEDRQWFCVRIKGETVSLSVDEAEALMGEVQQTPRFLEFQKECADHAIKLMNESRTAVSAEHFPAPWHVDRLTATVYATDVPKGPARVADIRGWGYLTGNGHGALALTADEAIGIQRANADFIVKAVNNHEALVKTLADAQRIIERDFPTGQLAIDIRTTLAAVGGSRE